MKKMETAIADVLIFEPIVFGDQRGFFYESFNEKIFRELTGLDVHFVQDNHSRSLQGVLRGLHYQLPPAAQGKLVHCVAGRVFDVAVDIRRDSPTFGKWVGHLLSAENRLQMWIPPGFAHGFLVVSEAAEFQYKVTDYYAPGQERAIRWDDPDLQIAWPDAVTPMLSAKDAAAPRFRDAEYFAIA
jgi:dTDP-4-dehydrorhamnose 3,5-epimerase